MNEIILWFNMKLTILLCMSIDISITYYYFYLNRKRNAVDARDEKGFIGHLLFKWFGYSPLSLMLNGIILIILLLGFMYIADNNNSLSYDLQPLYFYFTWLGIYVIVLWFNLMQILKIRRNWNNDLYWEFRKEMIKVTL